jgi:hypothetical protein
MKEVVKDIEFAVYGMCVTEEGYRMRVARGVRGVKGVGRVLAGGVIDAEETGEVVGVIERVVGRWNARA